MRSLDSEEIGVQRLAAVVHVDVDVAAVVAEPPTICSVTALSASLPVTIVTSSAESPTITSSSAVAAPSTEGATATMPSPRTSPSQSPSTIAPTLLRAVADRPGDLPGHHRRGGFGHLGSVVGRGCVGVVGNERRQRLRHRPGRHDHDRLLGQRLELLGDRDDVLVVRQHDDLVGVDPLDRLEQLRRRRVHRLAAGDDTLHTELGEEFDEATSRTDRHHGGGDRRAAPRQRARRARSRPARPRASRAPRRPPRTGR